MKNRIRSLLGLVAATLMFFIAARGVAVAEEGADTDALLEKMTTLNSGAVEDYSEGDFDRAKARLLQAVAIGKKDATLQGHPMMARTFVHLGALYVDGFEDRKAGIGYFVKALQLRPDIGVTESLVTKTVQEAFDEAKQQTAKVSPSAVAATRAAATVDKNRYEAEAKERSKQAQAEREKSQNALAALKESEAKERAAKEKVLAEKQVTDKALADAKAQALALQKEKADKDKQALADKDKLQKDLASVRDSETKERTAKEKLMAEKATLEKALGDAKAQLQVLAKEKADKEKQVADLAERERREKEAKEKLLAEKQAAEAREKQRVADDEAARVARAKLAEGPAVPTNFSEPILCNLPDEAQAGAELFVHCVTKSNLRAKDMAVAVYYRSNASTHYNSIELQPSKKGWQTAVVPASHVSGKALQYYVEVRDARGNVAAANGRAASPNILSLRPAGSARLGSESSGRKEAVLINKR